MLRRRGRAGGLRERIDVIAIVLTGVGVLFGVWRMVDGARRELGARIDATTAELRRELGGRIDAVNARIDAVLLAERQPSK